MKEIIKKAFCFGALLTCAGSASAWTLQWDEDEVLDEIIAWEKLPSYRHNNSICMGLNVTQVINDQSTSFNGTSGNDVIWVDLSSAHTIDALGGDDVVCVFGDGDLTIHGNSGVDVIYLNGDSYASYTVYGDDQNDYVYEYQSFGDSGWASLIIPEIYGGSGDDKIVCAKYSINHCTAFGNAGKDRIYGSEGPDVLDGGSGNDDIYGYDGDDSINGGTENDRLYGGNGLDIIHGNAGNDRLMGDAGNDFLYGDSGNDYHDGGTGVDTAVDNSGSNTFKNIEH